MLALPVQVLHVDVIRNATPQQQEGRAQHTTYWDGSGDVMKTARFCMAFILLRFQSKLVFVGRDGIENVHVLMLFLVAFML